MKLLDVTHALEADGWRVTGGGPKLLYLERADVQIKAWEQHGVVRIVETDDGDLLDAAEAVQAEIEKG